MVFKCRQRSGRKELAPRVQPQQGQHGLGVDCLGSGLGQLGSGPGPATDSYITSSELVSTLSLGFLTYQMDIREVIMLPYCGRSIRTSTGSVSASIVLLFKQAAWCCTERRREQEEAREEAAAALQVRGDGACGGGGGWATGLGKAQGRRRWDGVGSMTVGSCQDRELALPLPGLLWTQAFSGDAWQAEGRPLLSRTPHFSLSAEEDLNSVVIRRCHLLGPKLALNANQEGNHHNVKQTCLSFLAPQ